jgi:hypothetical protein
MDMMKRYIGVLLLLAFLSGKYTLLFGQTKESVQTHWSKSTEDPSEENKEKEEETKEPKSPFDELFYHDSPFLKVYFPSRTVNTQYLLIDPSPYLSSMYLPPEA